ncbi:MAG: M1 family metallopeptidase [Bacteroidales bacterium]|nr:M1 family metallopeptidase [Bacteroidales bacterium]
MNKCFILILGFACTFGLNTGTAQEYYLPYNLKEAYTKGSRDYYGNPGKNYFQNSADYKLQVSFDATKGLLKGKGEIIYYNNSPDSLYYLVIRLYHDILKRGNLRDEDLPDGYITNGVKIKSLVIDGNQYVSNNSFYLNRSGTNMVVGLNQYLIPQGSVNLQIEWETKIPAGHIHRFGNYGPSDWFVAYWYPQIAVYDDIDGWDLLDYTGTCEFYNNFNNYQVEISVPSGHMVWATGLWTNPEDIVSEKIIKKIGQAAIADETVHVITADDWQNNMVFKKKRATTFCFKAENITDFAFAVSDNYLCDATSVTSNLTDSSRTVVYAVYPEENREFATISEIGAKSIGHFVKQSIKIPYPFGQVTIFNGDGGMEFPMMVNQRCPGQEECNFIAMHELFHGYFPFLTGLNERTYAWMDEGLTSYIPMGTESYLGGNYFQLPMVCKLYSDFAGSGTEVPLMAPSSNTRGYSYYHQAYYKSTMALFMIENYLGSEIFRNFIASFANNWKGKHPTGYDFIFALEHFAGENLYWLINPWFFEQAWVDLGIEKVSQNGENIEVTIANIGGLPVPVEISVELADGSTISTSQKADIWKNSNRQVTIVVGSAAKYQLIRLGSPFIPDKTPENNTYKR